MSASDQLAGVPLTPLVREHALKLLVRPGAPAGAGTVIVEAIHDDTL